MRQLRITSSITSREDISLDKYLADVSRERLINSEDEVHLAQQIRIGNQAALDQLVRANLRFVVSVAKQYQNKGMTLGDLINEGNVGLIKAAKKFDETRGFKFISYAVWWIRQSMIQAMAENSRVIRLPLNRHAIISKIKKGTASLEQKLERDPTAAELAEITELSLGDIETGLMNTGHTFSMDAPVSIGENLTFGDLMPGLNLDSPDQQLLQDSLQTDITRLLAGLSKREADILKMYYGIGGNHTHTLDEIGTLMSLTRERVRQVKESALRQLRRTTSRVLLMHYLG